MRKSYLMIAAAATILASCAESEKINNDLKDNAKTPIGFNTFNEKLTRADLSNGTALEAYHNTFMVYGTKVSTIETTENPQYVFGEPADATNAVEGTLCTYQTTLWYESNWKYDNERFWDKQATYNFIAYAPQAAPLKYKYASATAGVGTSGNVFVTTAAYTLYGQNLQDGAKGTDAEKLTGFTESDATTTKDIDIMVSDLESGLNGASYANVTPKQHVNLLFHHILTKLNVLVGKDAQLNDSEVLVKSITIDGLKHVGTYDGSKWTAQDREATSTYALDFNKALTESNFTELPDADDTTTPTTINHKYFVESLVMPQTLPDVCNLTIKYQITTGTHVEQYTSQQDISSDAIFTKFNDKTNYTLKILISPTVITFDAAANEWDLTGEAGYTVY